MISILKNNVFRLLIFACLCVLVRILGELYWYRIERPPIHQLELDDPTTTTRYVMPTGIFYFGITHHSVHNLAFAADNTWVKRVMPEGQFPWFSDEFTSVLKNLTIIKAPNGISPNRTFLYHRVMEVWKHVMITYKGFDWYVQCWEDNYVIKERMEEIASKYNPNELIEIGRLHDDFIDGGSPHLMSRAMFDAYSKIIDKHPRHFHFNDFYYNTGEDMVQSFFKRKHLKIKYVKNNAAFNHCAPEWAADKSKCFTPTYSKEDLTCRRTISDNGAGSGMILGGMSPPDLPATFHYVSYEGQYLIDDLLYVKKCL